MNAALTQNVEPTLDSGVVTSTSCTNKLSPDRSIRHPAIVAAQSLGACSTKIGHGHRTRNALSHRLSWRLLARTWDFHVEPRRASPTGLRWLIRYWRPSHAPQAGINASLRYCPPEIAGYRYLDSIQDTHPLYSPYLSPM